MGAPSRTWLGVSRSVRAYGGVPAPADVKLIVGIGDQFVSTEIVELPRV